MAPGGKVLAPSYKRRRRSLAGGHHPPAQDAGGAATPDLSAPGLEWRGQDTCIQKEGIADNCGVVNGLDAFYARHGSNLPGLKRGLYQPVAARLSAVRRILAIVLLAMLPLQFSWAAVASYCGHESQASTGHFGHHDHAHHADAGRDAGPAADPGAGLSASPDEAGGAKDDKAASALDLDCGHCHGTCSAMLTLPMGLPGALSTALPSATLDESGGAHAPTRPERPQWLPLA